MKTKLKTIIGGFLIMWNMFGANAHGATPESIQEQVKKGEAVIIDVREPYEVSSGMIKGAKNIPLGSIPDQKNLTSLKKEKVVYVYCRSGNRSGQATSFLKAKGINAINLGGYEMLRLQGFSAK